MDKILNGIGRLTVLYVGLYLIDSVAVRTGIDRRLERVFDSIFKTNKEPKTVERNKVDIGFH